MSYVYPYGIELNSLEFLTDYLENSTLGSLYQNLFYGETTANLCFNTELDMDQLVVLDSLMTNYINPIICKELIVPLMSIQKDVNTIDYNTICNWSYNPHVDRRLNKLTFKSSILANSTDNTTSSTFGYGVRWMDITHNVEISNITLNNMIMTQNELVSSTLSNHSILNLELQCKKFALGNKVNISDINLYFD